jgi:hypothetical protein
MYLRMSLPPTAPGEGVQAMNFAHCLHIGLVFDIGKHTDTFRGGGIFFQRCYMGARPYPGG